MGERGFGLDESAMEEMTPDPVMQHEGVGHFLRRISLRLLITWLVLVVLSYQCYLVDARQLLAHPVDTFAQSIGLAVYSSSIEITTKLPDATSFADIKAQAIRAGRLLGASARGGVLDAEASEEYQLLRWTTIDGKDRQLVITASKAQQGDTVLSIEIRDYRPRESGKIKDVVTELNLVCARLGRVQSSHLQVQGVVCAQTEIPWLSYVQSWRLTDCSVVQNGQGVEITGATPDLAYGTRTPATFALSFIPDTVGKDGGRLLFVVKNQQ